MQTFPEFPAPASFGKVKGKPTMGYVFENMTEFTDFAKSVKHSMKFDCQKETFDNWRGDGFSVAVQKSVQGDMANVEASDALMERLQDAIGIESTRLKWSDSVAGGFPNVPAAIAGQPLSMRTRQRERTASAPLAIVMDLTTSAGISTEQIRKRGACILALARLISAIRPTELYVSVALDAFGMEGAIYQFIRIETAPLDLPRACYAMMANAFPRRLGYGIASSTGDYRGYWPYGTDTDLPRQIYRQACAHFLPHASELLAIPAMKINDDTVDNPEQWLRDRLAEFAPQVALA